MLVVYGSKVFSKFMGYYGDKVMCPTCGKVYSGAIVRHTRWATLYYAPLFPIKTTYEIMCPVCGSSAVLDKQTAKHLLKETPQAADQDFTIYAKHILANKKKGLLSGDNSYEMWVRDNRTGEQTCIAAGIAKDQIKNTKKERGLSVLPVVDE